MIRIVRAVRRLPELLALDAQLTITPDQFHALAEGLGEGRMRRGIDPLGHQHSLDSVLQDLALRPRCYPPLIGDVVQVRDKGPDIRVTRLLQGLLDGERARRPGRLPVTDPLEFAHLRGVT